MTAPYYTAGPADPKASTRAKLYSGLALVTPLLAFLSSFGIFTADQVNSVSGFLTAALGLLGAFGFGLAATKTNQQVKDGTFDPPPPPPSSPVLDAFQSVTAIKQHVDDTVNQAQEKVTEGIAMIQGATQLIPGLGGVGADLSGPVRDLIRSVTGDDKR